MSSASYQERLARELFPALRGGGVLVTRTGRLARRIRFRYGQWRRAVNAAVWQRPAVHSWQEWMRQLWEQSLLRGGEAGGRALLSPHGSRMLWEQALSEDAVAGFGLEQNAELARRSWNLALEYGLSLERLRSEADGEDERRFVRWAARFEALRGPAAWLEPAALPQLLAQDLQAGAVAVRGPLYLLGLEGPLPPSQKIFLNALRCAGVALEQAPRAPVAASACRIECESGDEELREAASWAGAGNAGLVVVDFNERAPQARRALLDRMQPAWQARGFPENAPLNSAESPPLGHVGPTEMALDALHLLAGPPSVLDFEVVSRVLRGAYLRGADSEAGERARLERQIRSQLVGGEISRSQLMWLASEKKAPLFPKVPQFVEMLGQASKISRNERGKGKARSHRDWAATFTAFLRELGWPGQRALASSEQQAVEAFARLLSEFGACDAVSSRPMPLREALKRLRGMAQERKFQPQGPDEAVELLPLEEAAGMRFDRLWVAGAGASLWPKAARPAPLLPLGLQRRLKMPQASPQAALDQARRQTKALMRCAEEIVFSWSKVAEEGVETSCSSLIGSLPLRQRPSAAAPEAASYAEKLRISAALETLDDDPAPPLQENEEIKGGTRLMDHQLNNPFRAFAEFRLHAKEYPMPYDGLSPLARGDILHKLLCRLYTEFPDSASLGDAMPGLAERLEEWAAEIPKDKPPGYRKLVLGLLRLERERAAQLALDWARLDMERGDFNVQECEAAKEIGLGPLTLRMLLDRVDSAAAEVGPVVLDYKTGQEQALSGLDPERLRSSQLPAYALATPGVAGVGYVFLGGKRILVKGICDPGIAEPAMAGLPKLAPISGHRDFKRYLRWEDLLAGWRSALEAAADGLSQGDARLEIFAYENRARSQYQVLSRIQELERA